VTERLIRWFGINVFIGSIPLILAVLIRYFVAPLTWQVVETLLLEILFLAATISIASLSDLIDALPIIQHRRSLITAAIWFFILSSVLLTAVYGALLADNIVNLGIPGYRQRATNFSIVYALAVLVVGVAVQVFLPVHPVTTTPTSSPRSPGTVVGSIPATSNTGQAGKTRGNKSKKQQP
jgi:hypothetical protein